MNTNKSLYTTFYNKLKIIKTETPTWHNDVSFYSIKNEDDEAEQES